MVFSVEDAEYEYAAAVVVVVRVGIVADDLAGNGRNGDYEAASPATAVAASSGCDTSNGIYLVDARRRRRCGKDDRDERQMIWSVVIPMPGMYVDVHCSCCSMVMRHAFVPLLISRKPIEDDRCPPLLSQSIE